MASLHIALLLAFTLSLGSFAPDVIAAPPGDGWVPFDGMTDEFNADNLDRSRWHDRNPGWKGREPVYFHPECVCLENGLLKLSAFDSERSAELGLPPGFTHASGYLRSKALARFGYFETRVKMMDGPLVSCFWLSEHAREEWSEIDIAECPAGVPDYASVVPTNAHYFYGPHYRGTLDKHLVMPKRVKMPFRLAADFHVYGLEWTPTRLRWYVDDKLIREAPNKYNYQPLKMSINLEANSYFGAVPNGDERLPGEYQIDWVRSWRRDKHAGTAEK